ncbi:VOC family protein [Halorhabdus rudnickae]|uniref:VOC family protein n=1 Tax=Halorhabdus rudnickae TaxID=1775544 RepID=UPI00143833D3|nr:VOC family protein [Halorhabdus rudnickae]
MEARAVDFIMYNVTDLETALPFYRDTLGLDLEEHLAEFGWAEFAVEPTTLALNELDFEGDQGPNAGGAAVALSVDDVEAAIEEVSAAGGTVLQEPMETEVCDMATVADPDDNPITLHHRHDGTAGRRDPFP